MKCKHYEENIQKCKCFDYYYSHGTKKRGCFCRLKEWKQKKGICPYDKNIFSKTLQIKNKNQRTLI